MASNVIPVRIAHGWAIAWLDLYQTPAVVAESFTSSVKGFFGEMFRGKSDYPHGAFNVHNNKTNRLGRQRKYADTDKQFAFGSPY